MRLFTPAPADLPSLASRKGELLLFAGLTLLACLLFAIWPELDLITSGWFYLPEKQAFMLWRDDWLLFVPYILFPRLGQLLALGVIACWLYGLWRRWQGASLQAYRLFFGFFIASALIGQVAIVGQGLKEHYGRSRPIDVQPFNGEKRFTPALQPADQCETNCSFVSGHVAEAAFMMVFGWLGPLRARRRWLKIAAVLSAIMIVARMIPGGHFLSDGVFAFLITYWSLWLTELLFRWRGWWPPDPGQGANP